MIIRLDIDVVPISGNTPGGSIVGIALNSGSIVGITPGKLITFRQGVAGTFKG